MSAQDERIIIESNKSGLADRYWESAAGYSVKAKNTTSLVSGITNPFIYPDQLTPGIAKSVPLNGTSGQVNKFLSSNASNSDKAYALEDTKLHSIFNSSINDLIDNHASFPYTLVGTNPVGTDLADYQVNGVRKLFISYIDTGGNGGQVRTYDYTSTFSANVFAATSNFDDDFDLIMEVADNGFLYTGNSNKVHKFDGTTNGGSSGTPTLDVLEFDIATMVTDLLDHSGKLWIATQEASTLTSSVAPNSFDRCRINIWNRSSTSIGLDDSLLLENVIDISALFVFNGTAHCIVTSNDGVVQLRGYYNGKFVVVKELGSNTVGVNPTPVGRNSVIQFRQGILWQVSNGTLFYYGHVDGVDGLHKVFYPGTATTEGAIMSDNTPPTTSTNGQKVYVGNIHSVYLFDESLIMDENGDNVVNTVTSQEDIETPMYEIPTNSIIKGIKILYPKVSSPSSKSITVKIYTNYDGTVKKTLTITFPANNTGYFEQELMIPKTFAVSVAIDIPATDGANKAMRPSRIEIEYQPTTQK